MNTANLSNLFRRLTRGMATQMLGGHSDQQLVERVLGTRDETAFQAIVYRHGPMIFGVCWRILQHAQDAEDTFQATFLVLAQKLHTLRKHASLASWLHGVAHRLALKTKAQSAMRRHREQQAARAETLPRDDTTWGELRTALDWELGRLPDKRRLPLILCYLEGRTQDESARLLGWSKITLRRRLDEALAALRSRLSKRGLVLPAALTTVLLADCCASASPGPRLVAATAEAALNVVAGQSLSRCGVSAKVAALAKAGLAFGSKKVVILASLCWIALAIAAGTWLQTGQRWPTLFAVTTLLPNGNQNAVQEIAPHKVRGAAVGPLEKTDVDKIKGTWVVVESKKPDSNGDKFVFGDGEGFISFKGRDLILKFAFILNPRRNPKELDIIIEDGPDKGRILKYIYSFENNSLRICFDGRAFAGLAVDEAARPSEFKDDDQQILYTLRRQDSER